MSDYNLNTYIANISATRSEPSTSLIGRLQLDSAYVNYQPQQPNGKARCSFIQNNLWIFMSNGIVSFTGPMGVA